MTKEQLLLFKHTARNPTAGVQDISLAYLKVKELIEKNVKEDYIQEIFIARFLHLKSWQAIGTQCNGLTSDCVRKIVERYIKKTQKGGE